MRLITSLTGLTAVLAGSAAQAQQSGELDLIGTPVDGGMGFQPAATGIARELQWLDGMVLVIITAITLFVMALMAIIVLRYRQGVNKTPARFTHNTPVEVTWTVVPVVILLFIGAFSLPVLFTQQEIPEADVTIKTTGYQWYWEYEYPDHEFNYTSFMIGQGSNYVTEEIRQQLQENGYTEDEFRLATDTAMVVPVDQTIVLQVTAADVIHSWTVPAFGVKQDAIPGRLAELWFRADQEGVYFGQCSELCGKDHAFMPITVKVVSQQEYEAWLDAQIEEYAGKPRQDAGVRVASSN